MCTRATNTAGRYLKLQEYMTGLIAVAGGLTEKVKLTVNNPPCKLGMRSNMRNIQREEHWWVKESDVVITSAKHISAVQYHELKATRNFFEALVTINLDNAVSHLSSSPPPRNTKVKNLEDEQFSMG